MINHTEFSETSFSGKRALARLIKENIITLAGNKKLKIYGLPSCRSGKRMKVSNRVFFRDETEAIAQGYRPCGHCLRTKYLKAAGN
jgi:methylphosphotriester-DNA--protein-cysteine methyltransferase